MKKKITMPLLLLLTVAAAGTADASDFSFKKSTDPMTDADSSSVVTMATDGEKALAWVCRGIELNVVFTFDKYMTGKSMTGATPSVYIAYRFAPLPPWGAGWELGPNHRSAAMSVYEVTSFTVQALQQRHLALRVVDVNGDRVTGEFDLEDLGDSLRRLPCAARLFS